MAIHVAFLSRGSPVCICLFIKLTQKGVVFSFLSGFPLLLNVLLKRLFVVCSKCSQLILLSWWRLGTPGSMAKR